MLYFIFFLIFIFIYLFNLSAVGLSYLMWDSISGM